MIISFILSIKLTIPSHLFLSQAMIPLIRIINSVIRRFGRAHAKNPALVVEILFQHSHIQKHILSIDNVYEATNYFHGKSQGVSDFNYYLLIYIFFTNFYYIMPIKNSSFDSKMQFARFSP